jgi:hypothetical protein
MRRLLTWLGLAAALAYVVERFRRRTPAVEPADPAAELKQKLAESRTDESAPHEPEPEVHHPDARQPEAPAEPDVPLDERRRAVHDRARAAMDDMLGGEHLPGEETE